MPQPTTPLQPQITYHIYTHANGSENLFREDENYYYFLNKYSEYIHPIAETFAYCLMPNHIHLMVRMRGEGELLKFFSSKQKDLTGFQNLSGLISRQFGNFLNAYAKAYNERFDRRGSLFERPFGRKPIENASYFTALIAYIHNNPVHHGFVKDAREWPHSSYHSYLLDKRTKIAREEGLEWFGGREEFIKIHQELKKKDVMLEFES